MHFRDCNFGEQNDNWNRHDFFPFFYLVRFFSIHRMSNCRCICHNFKLNLEATASLQVTFTTFRSDMCAQCSHAVWIIIDRYLNKISDGPKPLGTNLREFRVVVYHSTECRSELNFVAFKLKMSRTQFSHFNLSRQKNADIFIQFDNVLTNYVLHVCRQVCVISIEEAVSWMKIERF